MIEIIKREWKIFKMIIFTKEFEWCMLSSTFFIQIALCLLAIAREAI